MLVHNCFWWLGQVNEQLSGWIDVFLMGGGKGHDKIVQNMLAVVLQEELGLGNLGNKLKWGA